MNDAWTLTKSCLAVAAALCSFSSHADGILSISDAWVREAPPHAEISAAYLTLHNHSNRLLRLTQGSSPQFQKLEFHGSRIVNGQVRMRRMRELSIPAHGSLELKPGGDHLMLIKPLQALKAGDKIDLTLKSSDDQAFTVQAPIRNALEEDKASHHHDMHDMHDMKM